MISETTTLLTLSLYLAALTYFIGVLIYMLPLPFKGLKEWGPTLIKDAIYVTVWISIYNYVLGFAQGMLTAFGTSWNNYLSYLGSEETSLGEIYLYILFLYFLTYLPQLIQSYWKIDLTSLTGIILFVASFLINFFLGGIIHNIQDLLKSLASETLNIIFFLIVLQTISLLIYKGAPILIVLGILLMSLPFRIGRRAGSMFIATALVFYIGIPLMPVVLKPFYYMTAGQPPSFYISVLQGLMINPFAFVRSAPFLLSMIRFEIEDLTIAYFIFLATLVFGVGDLIGVATATEIIELQSHLKYKAGVIDDDDEDEED